jgi:alkylation response protein AidB-like acyl-CoA dehydrogenase
MKLAFAQTEDGARYDLHHVATTARPDGEGFILDGVKRVVLHAPQVDRLLVSARTSGATRDEKGISLFVVDAKAAGIKMTAYTTIDELRGADVTFKGVRVPAGALIGEIDKGLVVIKEGVDYGSALLCAEAVGAMKYACDATLEYLKTRKQFGVPIGSFQALQHRMVDMVIEKEQCLSMASLAVGAFGTRDDERGALIAAAALRTRHGCERVSQEAIQLHGGMGMTEELKVSHTFRRLTAFVLRIP